MAYFTWRCQRNYFFCISINKVLSNASQIQWVSPGLEHVRNNGLHKRLCVMVVRRYVFKRLRTEKLLGLWQLSREWWGRFWPTRSLLRAFCEQLATPRERWQLLQLSMALPFQLEQGQMATTSSVSPATRRPCPVDMCQRFLSKRSSICLWLGLPGLELRQHVSDGTSLDVFYENVKSWEKLLPAKCWCIWKLLTGVSWHTRLIVIVSDRFFGRGHEVSKCIVSAARLLSRKCRLMSIDLCASSHFVDLLWRLVDSSSVAPNTSLAMLRPKEVVIFCTRVKIPEAFPEYSPDSIATSFSVSCKAV